MRDLGEEMNFCAVAPFKGNNSKCCTPSAGGYLCNFPVYGVNALCGSFPRGCKYAQVSPMLKQKQIENKLKILSSSQYYFLATATSLLAFIIRH
jgi:hypothetical protein